MEGHEKIRLNPCDFFCFLFYVLSGTRKSIKLIDVSRIKELSMKEINKKYAVEIDWTMNSVYSTFKLFPEHFSVNGDSVRWLGPERQRSFLLYDFGHEGFINDFVESLTIACKEVLPDFEEIRKKYFNLYQLKCSAMDFVASLEKFESSENFDTFVGGDGNVFQNVALSDVVESMNKLSKELNEIIERSKMINRELEEKAFALARRGHGDSTRKDGITPYINHPVDVVECLRLWGVEDSETIAAAYAHDLLEDTDITEEEIEKELGVSVLNKVKLLTHSDDISKEEYLSNLSETEDLSVLLIKASDRLCNVLDFVFLNRGAYGKEYFAKAKKIFDRIDKERDRIVGYDGYKEQKNSVESIINFF